MARGGGRNWIRTSEGVSQQIYSLPPLATWVSYQPVCQHEAGGRRANRVSAIIVCEGVWHATENRRRILPFRLVPASCGDGLHRPAWRLAPPDGRRRRRVLCMGRNRGQAHLAEISRATRNLIEPEPEALAHRAMGGRPGGSSGLRKRPWRGGAGARQFRQKRTRMHRCTRVERRRGIRSSTLADIPSRCPRRRR